MMELEIEYAGIPMTITGYYIKAEDSVMYYSDMSGNPGMASHFDIAKVLVGGIDIWEILSTSQLNSLYQMCIEKIEE